MSDGREHFLHWLDRHELPRSPIYPCPYLPGQLARQAGFASDELDPETYHDLMDRGFRRNGALFYRMDCPDCRRCVPLRVPVAGFRPTRSQRRARRRNADLRVEFRRPEYQVESFDLYRRYLRAQHPDTPADEDEGQFRDSLYGDVVDSLEARYLVDDRLVAVSLLDVCSRSLSAVYHFFDPAERRRSLGVHSALAEIEHASSIGVPYYYFGYWIEGAKTMSYKADYGPHEQLRGGVWQRDPP